VLVGRSAAAELIGRRCTGAEALVVLRDLCDLEPEETEDTLRWAARALLTAATNDARRAKRETRTKG
jgi:hypothetical protein